MFKEERDEAQFEWSMLGDIEKGRPNLGPMVNVAVYRLMQYTLRDIIIRDFSVEEADRLFFDAGKKAGAEYCRNLLPEAKSLDAFFNELQGTGHWSISCGVCRSGTRILCGDCSRRPGLFRNTHLF